MNKTKVLCHLGGVALVLAAVLLVGFFIIVPFNLIPYIVIGVVACLFCFQLYAIGYVTVKRKLNG